MLLRTKGDDFVAAAKKEPCCEDMEPTDADKKAVRLLKKHQVSPILGPGRA